MKRIKPFWIKERDNGQSPPYFVACGRLSVAAAKRKEQPLAGSNIMHRFDSEEAYSAKLAELRQAGERIYAQ